MGRFIGSQSLKGTNQAADNASASETAAAASAAAAATSATNAQTSYDNASSSATAANNYKTSAETAANTSTTNLATFRGDYLGDHATDSAADSHASSNSFAVTVGTMYFNSTNSQMRVCTATGSPNNTYEAVNSAAVSAGRYLQTGDGTNVIDAGANVSGGAKTTTDLTVGTPGGTSKDLRVTGDTQLDGNLTVSGTTTTVNTATLDVADNQITLNSDVTGTPSENAGIVVNRGSSADKSLLWDEGTDKWTVGSETLVAGTVEANVTGNVTGTTSSISNHSTDDLSEGSTNKYFSGKTTTDLAEGTNLYWTDSRFDTRFGNKTSDDMTQGTNNLFMTNTAWDNRLAAKTTDNLTEGSSNLWYTDERVDDRVNTLVTDGEGITTTYDDAAGTLTVAAEDATSNNKGIASFVTADFSVTGGAVSLVDLDTTHIAASALVTESDAIASNDNDTTIPTSAAVKDYVDTNVTAQDLDFATDTGSGGTVDLDSQALSVLGGEGMNVTHSGQVITVAGEDADNTNKGIASFSADHFGVSSGAVTLKADGIDDTHIDFGTGTNQVNTDVLTEGSTNQYHTTARARSSISATGGGISYNNTTGVLTSTAVDEALALSIALG